MKISMNLFCLLALLLMVMFSGCSKPKYICEGVSLEQCRKNAYGCHDYLMKVTDNIPLPDSTENIWIFIPEVDNFDIGQGESSHSFVFTIKDDKELASFIFKLTKTRLEDLQDRFETTVISDGYPYSHKEGEFPSYINEIENGKYRENKRPLIIIDMDKNIVYIET